DLVIRRPSQPIRVLDLFRATHTSATPIPKESEEGAPIEIPAISAAKIASQIAFQCAPDLDLLLHGLQPLLRRLPDALGLLTVDPNGQARSLAHQILATLVDVAELPDM